MKLSKIQSKLKKLKLDGCVLDSSDPNFRYYVQEEAMSGMLYIPKSGKPIIFLHPLEDLKHDFNIVRMEKKFKTVKEFFKDISKKKQNVGFNPSFTSVRQANNLKKIFKLNDIESELEEVRALKTDKEISYLKKAAKLADSILLDLIKNFKKYNFKTEGDIKKFLKTRMAELGVEQSFEAIVASEKGAATPHYFGDKKLKPGFLLIDMGVKWNGYCSDITRTFYLGKPKKNEIEIYNKVLKVQKTGIKMCKKGSKCSNAYNYTKDELGDKFTHGLGHGVGLKIHELPNLKPISEEKFKEGMVFTVEPGYYDEKAKIGIRIEDDVMIKNDKTVILTKTPKELIKLKWK